MSELAPDANDVTLIVRGGTTLDVRVLAADGETPVAGRRGDPRRRLRRATSRGATSQTFLVGRTDARGQPPLRRLARPHPDGPPLAPDHAPGMWAGMHGRVRVPRCREGPRDLEARVRPPTCGVHPARQGSVRARSRPGSRRAAESREPASAPCGSACPTRRASGVTTPGATSLVMPFGSELRVEAPGYAQSPGQLSRHHGSRAGRAHRARRGDGGGRRRDGARAAARRVAGRRRARSPAECRCRAPRLLRRDGAAGVRARRRSLPDGQRGAG